MGLFGGNLANGRRSALCFWLSVTLVATAFPVGSGGNTLPGAIDVASAAIVGEPHLVADVNPTENTEYGSTGLLTAFGKLVCFSGSDGIHGEELWCSDGTATGTKMVKDIRPGPGSSEPYWLTEVGDTLFFVAGDGVHGKELWRTDGTEAGTVLVEDIRSESTEDIFALSKAPESLTNLQDTLFFAAEDGVHGKELWRSDGSASGTHMVKDIYPGESPSSPNSLSGLGNSLLFVADDGIYGKELWRSDGTAAGTELVRDIHPGETDRYPGPANSNPAQLTVVDGTLFFVVTEDPVYGHEIWRSDGTEAGTEIVKDIVPGSGSSGPAGLTSINGTLFFTADYPSDGREELWRSDGTEAGTKIVIDPGWAESSTGQLVNVDGALFFVHERQLWRSDGTEAGTGPIGGANPEVPTYQEPAVIGNNLFFVASDAIHGKELWRSDGTAVGTEIIGDIYPGAATYPYPQSLAAVGSTLFFVTDDGIHGFDSLWKVQVDRPPIAVNDVATLVEGAHATAIDVLANDIDPDGGPRSIDSVTQPANGTVEIAGEGAALSYEPDPGYCNDLPGAGADNFEYVLAPGGSSASVTVRITCEDGYPDPDDHPHGSPPGKTVGPRHSCVPHPHDRRHGRVGWHNQRSHPGARSRRAHRLARKRRSNRRAGLWADQGRHCGDDRRSGHR